MNVSVSPPAAGLRRRLLSAGMNLLVLGSLAGLAWWGHRTGWHFQSAVTPVDSRPAETALAVRREGAAPSVRGIPTRGLFVEVPSIEDVDRLGIDVTPVWRTAVFDRVEANGELGFEPRRTLKVSSRLPGLAVIVLKRLGDAVSAGEVVAVVDAAEAGKAKTELLQAVAQRNLRRQNRENIRAAGSAVPERQQCELEAALREADVRVEAVRQSLANKGLPIPDDWLELPSSEALLGALRHAGLPADLVARLQSPSANLLPIRSAQAGVVISRDVVAGEYVEAGRTLLTVVDPSRLLVSLHLRGEDASAVAVGQKVLFRPDGSFEDREGIVESLAPSLDEATRTRLVRSSLANESGQLRAGLPGKGTFIRKQVADALVVPPEAVFQLGEARAVFVRNPDYLKPGAPKSFELRIVETGIRDGANLEIRSGLTRSDIVVTKGVTALLNRVEAYLDSPASKEGFR